MEQQTAQVLDVAQMVQLKLIDFAPKLVLAIMVLVLGWLGINLLVRTMRTVLTNYEFDQALERFVESITNALLKVVLVVTVAGIAGIETTSLVALLGAAGLAIGLALQGSLANFAGGVLILILKPFKYDDYIVAQGVEGKVQKIEVFSTTINTIDNQRIVIPNGALVNGVIVNKTGKETRRIDLPIGIGYDSLVDRARQVALGTVATDPRVLHDPMPEVVLIALGDSAQHIEVRFWVNTADFAAKFDLLEKIKIAFDGAGITIPYPQRVVHTAIAKSEKTKKVSKKSTS
ncbi:MAG: mechanosensitive ion channel [Candidatus Pacebacteria bacterium]|nr:mechanosensitive ion channel [Candidatus Paceibacterota bacterium]